ncbi:type VII secretion protein EccE [Antrihabitans stalactiti]|uniref:Type VII secretion protein EccE n=1 Tax=Antrihabitans stalactiti TaxID=2584121 RepID=A0A848KHR1_9NOCA|nr:type VII secretion protein EccE [Antrihabitans stalactiti]NMN96242.1 type VII secretion protein EccE [Antrihabitans stalactiti]
MLDRSGATPGPVLGKISVANLLVAQLIGIAVAVVCIASGVPGWVTVAVSIAVGAIWLIRVAQQSLLGWIATTWRYFTIKEYSLGNTVDYRAPSGRSLGLYWDGTTVVAVVEVLPPRGGLTRITREAFDSSHLLPLTALARSLHQHDVTLGGIDIISHGHRTRAGTPASGVYEQLIGPLPAVAVRNVWLAISLDAASSTDAVERRGGGREGASRAVTIATQRIVRALGDAGCRSRILTAPEIREAVLKITAGADPTRLAHDWKLARLGENVNIGSAINPNRLGSDLLAKIWIPQSRGTTVAVRLRPGSTSDSVSVGAGWRLTSRTEPDPIRLSGLVSRNGQHRAGVLAHLPIAVPGLENAIPVHEFPVDDLGRLHLPSSGCGQLVGSDEQQQGIATRIVGSGISTVYIAGEIYLAQQIVFRALAVGARVLIRTDRPHAWENLITTIANPERLLIAGEANNSNAGFNATVVDGGVAPPPHAGVTTIYLTTDPSRWPEAKPDVALHQPGAIGNRVLLETGAAKVELSLVTIPRESAFIGRARGSRVQPTGPQPGYESAARAVRSAVPHHAS